MIATLCRGFLVRAKSLRQVGLARGEARPAAVLPFLALMLLLILIEFPWIAAAHAGMAEDFAVGLTSDQREHFFAWRAARRSFDTKLDSYWTSVEAKRAERRRKKAARLDLVSTDYIQEFPPHYEGPSLKPDVARLWAKFLEAEEAKQPPLPQPPKEIPSVEDFLAAAKSVYGFTPERVSERAFKERYAQEAMELGLTKAQVVRIYALETSGQGTADMQSGVHPISKRGKPISTAIGYAQLLDANSVSELVKHGARFISRLEAMARARDIPNERALQLRDKASILRRMWADAKSVPDSWPRHQAFAKTPQGQGIHAINIDGDIGPMLQAIKLLGLKEEAEKAGKTRLSGCEMELMNLAGPGTGLEILLYPAGSAAPTPNFFARRAYTVNKMAQNLTGSGLLSELDKRMDADIARPGAIEFAQAFDDMGRALAAQR